VKDLFGNDTLVLAHTYPSLLRRYACSSAQYDKALKIATCVTSFTPFSCWWASTPTSASTPTTAAILALVQQKTCHPERTFESVRFIAQ